MHTCEVLYQNQVHAARYSFEKMAKITYRIIFILWYNFGFW